MEDFLGVSKENENFTRVKEKISKYLSYKSALTNLKSKRFKAIEFDYDKNNGRIKSMKFEELEE